MNSLCKLLFVFKFALWMLLVNPLSIADVGLCA
jgi:hypothetical protein